MLLVMALLAAQAQQASKVVTPLKPLTSPGTWVTDDDYPAAARRADQQGTVTFRLEIDTKGLPANCSIVASSGSSELDQETCALMLRRARFSPALDAAGKPVVAPYIGRFSWILGRSDNPPVTDGYARLEVEFSATGDVVHCKIHDSKMLKDLTSCSAFQGGVPEEFRRFAGADGKRRLVVIENAMAVDQPLPRLAYEEPGHVQLHYYRSQTTFDASGIPTSCTAAVQVGGRDAPLTPRPCDRRTMQAPQTPGGKPMAGTVTLISAASRVDL